MARSAKHLILRLCVTIDERFSHWAISGHSFKTISLQGEGVAYRGRILVELSTKLDQKADKAVDGIHTDDILVVQVAAWFV